MATEYPSYSKAEIGFLFFVYEYEFSGEHRVRLVYDGSRQSLNTFTDTYAPTVRAESVRLFHLYMVDHLLHLGQYDVPQAFLQSEVDCDLCLSSEGFFRSPRSASEVEGRCYTAPSSRLVYGFVSWTPSCVLWDLLLALWIHASTSGPNRILMS